MRGEHIPSCSQMSPHLDHRLLSHASRNPMPAVEAEVICPMAWKDIHGVTNAIEIIE